jgi:urea transport system ATP-binding protein
MANSTDLLLALERRRLLTGSRPVNALSLYVDKGELRVIIGPNGAGKTTVLDLICGRTKGFGRLDQVQNQEITDSGTWKSCASGSGASSRPHDLRRPHRVRNRALAAAWPNVAGALFWKRAGRS